jgi:hypothetical protein
MVCASRASVFGARDNFFLLQSTIGKDIYVASTRGDERAVVELLKEANETEVNYADEVPCRNSILDEFAVLALWCSNMVAIDRWLFLIVLTVVYCEGWKNRTLHCIGAWSCSCDAGAGGRRGRQGCAEQGQIDTWLLLGRGSCLTDVALGAAISLLV